MIRIVKILENIWYRDKKPPNFLIGLSVVYGTLLKIRRSLYNLGIFSTSKPEIPVIIIGNINVGGTGKTPFTLYLANTLSHLGKRVGLYREVIEEKNQVQNHSFSIKKARPKILVMRLFTYQNIQIQWFAFVKKIGCSKFTL